MSKLWIDRLENEQRRRLMLALRMGPSLGVIAIGGGLTTLAVAAGLFGLLGAAGKFLDTTIGSTITDKEAFSDLFGVVVKEDSGQLQQMGNDLAGRFGITRPVNIFIADGSVKSSRPVVSRGQSVAFHAKKKENLTLKELEFAMAHEIAHIKAEDYWSNVTLAKKLIEKGAVGVAMIVPIFTQASLPVMIASVGIVSAGLITARRLVKNCESRSIERCRDAEAVQKTGDLQSAISCLSKMTPLKKIINPPGILAGLFRTHPPYKERVLNLVEAYYRAVENGDIRPAAQLRAWHSTHQVASDRPLLSPQID